MDRRAIAREARRAQALEALEFEREREGALQAQVAEIVLEREGDRVDGEAFSRMSALNVERVREALHGAVDDWPGADQPDGGDAEVVEEDEGVEEELERLAAEIEACRARQDALARYVQALDEGPPTGPSA